MTGEIMRRRCEALINALVGKEYAPLWWNSPNKAFAGSTPEQVYEVDPTSIYAYLVKSAEGEW
jgi:hypothetical protein